MRISFGSFIPTKVYVNGKEIMPTQANKKTIEEVTLVACDCLSRHGNYPKTYLAEQQRRFFASQVPDYSFPTKQSANKTDLSASTVKTANINNRRYLVTGSDIEQYHRFGQQLGHDIKNSLRDIELNSYNDAETKEEQIRLDDLYNQKATAAISRECENRRARISDYIKGKVLPKTMHINASYNPNGKTKVERYTINLIDFK